MKPYRTIEGGAESVFIEKKSRFLGYAQPVTTEEEALRFLEKIRKRHWDATHNVYAYALREGNVCRFSDDGEPQGTAGMPVLNVLTKKEVTDLIVVVTRYFGGTLLGAGGLVRAYSHSAALTLQSAKIVTVRPCTLFAVEAPYPLYELCDQVLKRVGAGVESCDFAEKVTILGYIDSEKIRYLDKELTEASNGALALRTTGEAYMPLAEPDE